MARDRKKELIACAHAIIRNADKITEDLGFSQEIEVVIRMGCNEVPHIEINRDMCPKELLEDDGK